MSVSVNAHLVGWCLVGLNPDETVQGRSGCVLFEPVTITPE